MKKQIVIDWEIATEALTDHFVKKHFGKKGNCDVWWVASDIGGVLHINDRFFSLRDMVDFIKHSYTTDQLFEYYDYHLNASETNEVVICIRDWKKLKK